MALLFLKSLLVFPFLFFLLHAFRALGVKRTLGFFFLSSSLGFLSEVLTLRTGLLFGSSYSYNQEIILFFGVPIVVIAYWAVFVYLGYSLTNSFLTLFNKVKPNRKTGDWSTLTTLAVSDATFVVLIDLIMDPSLSEAGLWSWEPKGSFFGVPPDNFLNWFLVVILISFSFRLFEFFKPLKRKTEPSMNLVSTLAYSSVLLSFALIAFMENLSVIATMGFFLAILIPAIYLLLYSSKFKRDLKAKVGK